MRRIYVSSPAQPAVVPPPDPAIVAEAKHVFREALAASSDGGDRAVYFAALGAPLARLCAESKRREIPVERVIIALKHAWATLPDARWWRRDVDVELLSVVITACIEQYFLDGQRAPRRAD